MKKILSIILSITMLVTIFTAFSVTASAAIEIAPSDNLGNGTGDSNLAINAAEIPAPTYTVTIPTGVNFGTLTRTMSDEYQTADCSVTASGVSNLFANDKKLTVTVASANSYSITDGSSNKIPYTLYADYDNKTEFVNGVVMSILGKADADTNITQTVFGKAVINTKNVKKAGTFKDTLTFTVAISEVNS